jgi:hypothetical protein
MIDVVIIYMYNKAFLRSDFYIERRKISIDT